MTKKQLQIGTVLGVVKYAVMVAALYLAQNDVRRWLDQRDKALETDLGYKQARIMLLARGVHCDGS